MGLDFSKVTRSRVTDLTNCKISEVHFLADSELKEQVKSLEQACIQHKPSFQLSLLIKMLWIRLFRH